MAGFFTIGIAVYGVTPSTCIQKLKGQDSVPIFTITKVSKVVKGFADAKGRCNFVS